MAAQPGLVSQPDDLQALTQLGVARRTRDRLRATDQTRAVIDALRQLGITHVDQIPARLRSPDRRLVLQACRALGRVGKSSQAEALVPLLNSPDDEIASLACAALGSIGGKAHARVLLKVLMGSRPALWPACGTSLALLKNKPLAHRLMRLLTNTSGATEQRFAAMYALASTPMAPRDFESFRVALVALLGNEGEPARLRGLAAENLTGVERGRGRGSRAYRETGRAITLALRDPEPEVRFWSAFAIGGLRYREALPVLRELASNDQGRFGDWWTVGEEASDAVDHIEGREPPERHMLTRNIPA